MAAAPAPAPAGLPLDRLVPWLAGQGIDLAAPVTAELTPTGRSNPTYILTDAAGHRVVVRRPPFGGVLATAHDMSREWQFISAMHGPAAASRVPVPEPLAVCPDGEVIGAPFFVMSFVDGVVAETMAGLAPLGAAAAPTAAADLTDVLARLHQVDVGASGLGSLARPGPYLGRQLRRWLGAFDQSACRDIAAVAQAHERLLKARPGQAATTVVHGDFRIGNVVCGPRGTIEAVLDWELATIGDPLADLGWLVADWADKSAGLAVTELVSRYSRAADADVSDLPYYVAFARWRSACIVAGVITRYEAGVMADDGFRTVRAREQVALKAATALAILDGETDPLTTPALPAG